MRSRNSRHVGSNGLQNVGSDQQYQSQYPSYSQDGQPQQQQYAQYQQESLQQPQYQEQPQYAVGSPVEYSTQPLGQYGVISPAVEEEMRPDMANQFMANYYNYLQQQQAYAQNLQGQQNMLRQLYNQHPLPQSIGNNLQSSQYFGQPMQQQTGLITPEQYSNFLNNQHQNVLRQQQQQLSNYYTNPTAMMSPINHDTNNYSQADKVSHTRFTNGGVSYSY